MLSYRDAAGCEKFRLPGLPQLFPREALQQRDQRLQQPHPYRV